jgi:methylthioribose-1-phosphate isomerase
MKNEQEINDQLEILKSLDKELDKFENKVDELINTKDLEDSLRKCPPKKRAEVYWTAAFGIYTNKYLELLLNEKDPELHPIKKEITRLNDFRKKLINADKEEENNEEINKNKFGQKKKKENIYKKIKQLNEKNFSNNI